MIADEDLVVPEFAKGCRNMAENLVTGDSVVAVAFGVIADSITAFPAMSELKAITAKTATNIVALAVSRKGQPVTIKQRPELMDVRMVLAEAIAVLDEVLGVHDD